MKKLMISLATIALISGSVANATACVQKNDTLNKIIQKNSSNLKATNEDAEDIANKLWNKTIKIDPNVFLGKNLQTDKDQFNAILVKNGILTQEETQYVSWGNLNINIAGWYWNKGSYTVTKDGATATGHVTVDADPNETMQQLATKLENANIKFNYDYWNGKTIQNYSSEVKSMLVNEKILTKAEVSDVGVGGSATIQNPGQVAARFDVNDNNNEVTANVQLNVVNDGESATEIANDLHTQGQFCDDGAEWDENDTYYLKPNTTGLYADNAVVLQNLRNLLLNNGIGWWTSAAVNTITLPHVMLTNSKGGNNIHATITKDGQTADSLVDLVAYNYPFIAYEGYDEFGDNYDFDFTVNLNPTIIKDLASYFPSYKGDITKCLEYFYQVLSNGDLDTSLFPAISSHYFQWWDYLDGWADNTPFVQTGDTVSSDICYLCTGSFHGDPSNIKFGQALYNEIMNSKPNSYLSLSMDWYTDYNTWKTHYYRFW